ncbi:hypothetical protein QBC43DRAFT_204815 [Cladorrhinum sp. PSN259]|nr:hypothetical protein QBC43DRAFT_204815 [Cladorrhinum sp. PSN259]
MPESSASKTSEGARPLQPGDLDNFHSEGKRREILKRGLFLVRNHLEVPPHIKAAYEQVIKQEDGHNEWAKVGAKYINAIIDSLPRRLFDDLIYKREGLIEPEPATSAPYYHLMRRALLAEREFYDIDPQSVGSQLLHQFQQPSSVRGSFKHCLKHSGATIDKVIHFTRSVCIGAGNRYNETWPSLQLELERRRKFFIYDLENCLLPKNKNKKRASSEDGIIDIEQHFIPAYPALKIPGKPDVPAVDSVAFLEEGFMSINSRSLVYDTTLNSTLLKLMQEVDLRPAVIIKQFTFWRDGDDDESYGERPAKCAFYDVPHWLRDNYRVYHRQPGSGFVEPNATVYIRKGKSFTASLTSTFTTGGSSSSRKIATKR